MDCRCIACILSGQEDAVFNYPCISPIKTHDYITLQQNVPKVPGVCDRRQAAAVPVSGWAQVTSVRSMAEGSRAHDHHCPSPGGQRELRLCPPGLCQQERRGSAYLGSIGLTNQLHVAKSKTEHELSEECSATVFLGQQCIVYAALSKFSPLGETLLLAE